MNRIALAFTSRSKSIASANVPCFAGRNRKFSRESLAIVRSNALKPYSALTALEIPDRSKVSEENFGSPGAQRLIEFDVDTDTTGNLSMIRRMQLMKPLRVVFFGSCKFAMPSLRRLFEYYIKGEIATLEVGALKAQWVGKGKSKSVLKKTPVLDYVQTKAIPYFLLDKNKKWVDQIPPHISSPQEFSALPYDLCVTISFGRFIPGHILDLFQYGGFNVHPSLLPKYQGAAPIQWAILNGDKETGITIQTLSKENFDKGDVIVRDKVQIQQDMDYTMLHDILAERAAMLLSEFVLNRKFQYYKTLPPSLTLCPSLAPIVPDTDKKISLVTAEKAMRAVRAWIIVTAVLDYQKPVKLMGVKLYEEEVFLNNFRPFDFRPYKSTMIVHCANRDILCVDKILYKGQWQHAGLFAKSYNFGKGGKISPS